MKTDDLVLKILTKSLKNEIDNLLQMTRQGFDVFVYTEFIDTEIALKNLLQNEIQINPRVFRLIDCPIQIEFENDAELDFAFIPTILIGKHNLKGGSGFVYYPLSSPDKLIENVATCITEILTFFRLELYLDCFDAKLFSKLKEVARIRGVRALIDGVIQTAYLEGVLGNTSAAHLFLDKICLDPTMTINNNDISIESCAKRFLSYCILQGDNAYDFLKSSLSYYIAADQGHTVTRASQILNISRTTVMEHLKIAERLNMPNFFNGC